MAVRVVPLQGLKLLILILDNDFSDFELPEHYIRYIGELRATVLIKGTDLMNQSPSNQSSRLRSSMTWTNKVCYFQY